MTGKVQVNSTKGQKQKPRITYLCKVVSEANQGKFSYMFVVEDKGITNVKTINAMDLVKAYKSGKYEFTNIMLDGKEMKFTNGAKNRYGTYVVEKGKGNKIPSVVVARIETADGTLKAYRIVTASGQITNISLTLALQLYESKLLANVQKVQVSDGVYILKYLRGLMPVIKEEKVVQKKAATTKAVEQKHEQKQEKNQVTEQHKEGKEELKLNTSARISITGYGTVEEDMSTAHAILLVMFSRDEKDDAVYRKKLHEANAELLKKVPQEYRESLMPDDKKEEKSIGTLNQTNYIRVPIPMKSVPELFSPKCGTIEVFLTSIPVASRYIKDGEVDVVYDRLTLKTTGANTKSEKEAEQATPRYVLESAVLKNRKFTEVALDMQNKQIVRFVDENNPIETMDMTADMKRLVLCL